MELATFGGLKFNVGILGATGFVGQKFIFLLLRHKNFNLVKISGSQRNINKKFFEATKWHLSESLTDEQRHFLEKFTLVESKFDSFTDCQFVFSALPADIAGEIEESFSSQGIPVFSNARNHRMSKFVPILIPFVNEGHLSLVKSQKYFKDNGGFIVTNANCSTTGLAIALAPLHQKYGIEKVLVVTQQSISGSGYPGLPSLDILGNVIPYIADEEEKISAELKKIFAKLIPLSDNNSNGDLLDCVDANIQVSASCNRVPVFEGHLLNISVKLKDKMICSLPDNLFIDTIKDCYNEYSSSHTLFKMKIPLPSCPKSIFRLFHDKNDRPQSKFDLNEGEGFTTCIGRIRRCKILDLKMTVLTNNTIIGAAGGSILNAELCAHEGLISTRV